jgi:hemoglobin
VNKESCNYGVGDSSYKAAGELSGLTKLVDSFYNFMNSLPEAKVIRTMHSDDLALSRKKLAYFLSGWLGGPKLYSENFGSINIPSAHKHLPIGLAESDAWILCMQKAVAEQPYKESFKLYLIAQLRVPAERIRRTCGV